MRHSTRGRSHFRVRLACVKHAASVQSEPESNSPVQICTKISAWQKSESQSSLSTRSSLVNEPEKEFSLPPFFAAFVNMLFCHRFVNNFFGNLQKTFCEGFLKPAVSCGEGGFYAHPSCLSTAFFSFSRESSSRNLQRKAVFQAANATFTLPRQECQSFSKIFFQEHVFSFRLSSAPHGLSQ